MKKLLIAFALATVGCSSQSIVGPTGSASQAPTSSPAGNGSPAVDPSAATGSSTSVPSGGTSPTPLYSVTGPSGCVPAGSDPMEWILTVIDAGASPLRFVVMAHNAADPGCASTIDNPRSRVTVSGVQYYASHGTGQTTFTFDPRSFTCGRSQIDVSIFDAQGHEWLIVGMVVNYGTTCAPPPPPPPGTLELVCMPGSQQTEPNEAVMVTARGGTSQFTWRADSGVPSTGTGQSFTPAFATAGLHLVTVTSGQATKVCEVHVASTPPPPPPPPVLLDPVCSPGTQAASINAAVWLAASGGNGAFAWSGGGMPATGTGPAFSTAFAAAGTHTVSVMSGGVRGTCQVVVTDGPPPPPPPVTAPVCGPAVQSALVNQPVSMTATGGNGSYTWSGAGAPGSGVGASFSTMFATAGSQTVTVTSGGLTGTCAVVVMTVPPPPPPPPVGGQGCTPGYWKQPHHADSWTGVTPSTPFSAVFDDAFPGKTMDEVLALQGGGLDALGRHTVAALLNASSTAVRYDVTRSLVIAEFNRVFPGGDYEAVKNRFASFNEQGCPLN